MRGDGWTQSLSVGVPSIDNDHQFLLRVVTALRSGGFHTEADRLNRLIDQLTIFARIHFRREEQTFAAAGVPFDALHQQAHREFTAFLAGLRDPTAPTPAADRADALYNFLCTWIAQHVPEHDQKLLLETWRFIRLETVAREAGPEVEWLLDIH